ncbi:lipase family protein [Agromyces larvae]|uniref:DUF308 domain-containing protein n=1 Tax=Agromyces larvae TaxID=2929802 RepID=A0ABY4C2W6_9MICO|nr:lipase family protein [Agromyces larvae]UOE45664.1 DUF308 domain-containing protein [Agromyces larvae]
MAVGRRIRAWFRSLPRWVRAVVGLAAVVLGAVIVVRPTTALGVLAILIGAGLILTGILEAAGGGERDRAEQSSERTPRWRLLMAVVWIALGVGVLAWPGLTVRALAWVVGIGLIVNGVLSVVSAFRASRTADARVAAALLGTAGVVFGLLALLWADITLIIVAVVFGARLIVVGLLEVWHAVRGTARASTADAPPPTDAPPPMFARWARTIAAVLALVVAVGAGAVSASLRGGSPVVDEFYAAPRDVPDEPGRLIRAEPFTRQVPDGALAWRILYTTTDLSGEAAVASGLVVVPAEGAGDWPVVDWAHGTTGVAQQCAPSLLAEPFESGAMFVLPQIVEQGWAFVATDYLGLGTPTQHPYLIGPPSATAVLDARRAAAELDGARLGERTVVWGHSQGGGAALWTGALAAEYAPEVELDGVAALAPAANLPALVDHLPDVTGGSIFGAFAVFAYAAIYDDVTTREYVRPGAEVTVRRLASRCLSEPGTAASVLTLLGLAEDPELLAEDPTTGAFGARLAENIPPATISAPVLFGQGGADGLIVADAQEPILDALCAAGASVDFRVYADRGHVPLVEADSPLVPQLFEWTAARFAGEPVGEACTRAEF